jgi:GMP synthase-like glutamine amidotransferase
MNACKRTQQQQQQQQNDNFPFTFDSFVLNNTSVDVSKQMFMKQIEQATAIIITGSSNSAYDDEPWIHFLSNVLVQAHQRKVKLVGVCFGHQIIAHALGGRVTLNPQGHETGVCSFTATADALDYLSTIINNSSNSNSNSNSNGNSSHSDDNNNNSNSNQSNTAKIVTSDLSLFCWHGDVAVSIPNDCICGGSNDNTTNQFYYNQDNILCFQSHPEFNSEWVMTLATKYFLQSNNDNDNGNDNDNDNDKDRYHIVEQKVQELKDKITVDAMFVNDAIYHFCVNSIPSVVF